MNINLKALVILSVAHLITDLLRDRSPPSFLSSKRRITFPTRVQA